MSEWISPDTYRVEWMGAHWMEFDGVPTNETIHIAAVGGNSEWFRLEAYPNGILTLPFSGTVGDSLIAVYYIGPVDWGDTPYVDLQFLVGDAPAPSDGSIYSQPSIVPAAVSSELDNHGEERIHIAPYEDVKFPLPCTFVMFGEGVSWYDYSWPAGWSEDYDINVTLKRTGETTNLRIQGWGFFSFSWYPNDYYSWMVGDEVVFTQPETGWEFEAVICEEPFLYVAMERTRRNEDGDHFYVWREGAPWIDLGQNFKVTYGGITYETVYHIYQGSWTHTIENGEIPLPLTRVPATIELEDGTVHKCLLITYEPAPS